MASSVLPWLCSKSPRPCTKGEAWRETAMERMARGDGVVGELGGWGVGSWGVGCGGGWGGVGVWGLTQSRSREKLKAVGGAGVWGGGCV